MPNLADIINNALNSAGEGMKRASARDAAPVGGSLDFLEQEFPSAPKAKIASATEPQTTEKRASKEEVLTDADFAMKLASALEIGANIVSTKLAQSAIDAPGPAVTASGHQTTSTIPTANSVVTGKITGATTGPGGLPTTKDDFTSVNAGGGVTNHPEKTAGWTSDPETVRRVIRAKTAQAEVFAAMGDKASADRLLNEIKLAQDPSSPQPTMPAHNTSFKLDTERSQAGNVIPDNAGLIALTRASAREKSKQDLGSVLTEPMKKDPAVQAALGHSEGLKTSSARDYLIDIIKTASDPNASEEARNKAASDLRIVRARAARA
jgi:hypothetical protein